MAFVALGFFSLKFQFGKSPPLSIKPEVHRVGEFRVEDRRGFGTDAVSVIEKSSPPTEKQTERMPPAEMGSKSSGLTAYSCLVRSITFLRAFINL